MADLNDFPNWVRIALWIDLFLFVNIFNPWMSWLSEFACWILGIQLVIVLIVGLPVFLYQLLIKRKTFTDSFKISGQTIIDALGQAY